MSSAPRSGWAPVAAAAWLLVAAVAPPTLETAPARADERRGEDPGPPRGEPPGGPKRSAGAASAAGNPAEAQPPDAPWVLSGELRERLAAQAEHYREYALRFTNYETVRQAKYDAQGEASDESTRRYAYLLERSDDGKNLREVRQRTREDGTPKGDDVRDEEPFPPAYAWVDLFSRFHQPYFAFRDRGDRFDGFDWVRDVDFRGALGFSDGKDIRQWEGRVIVDAVTYTPLEIRAKPSGQDDRVRAVFDRWSRAFNLLGFRLAPRPLLYRCEVQFRFRKDGLTFPTELRYDTLLAVSSKQTVPLRASIRHYEQYRFFKTATSETPGRRVEP